MIYATLPPYVGKGLKCHLENYWNNGLGSMFIGTQMLNVKVIVLKSHCLVMEQK